MVRWTPILTEALRWLALPLTVPLFVIWAARDLMRKSAGRLDT